MFSCSCFAKMEASTSKQRSPKCTKITDYFSKERPVTEQRDRAMLTFLTRYQPTAILRHKRLVGRPRSQSRPDPVTQAPPQSSLEVEEVQRNKSRGVYKSFSLRQKLEIVKFARENSEAAASRWFGVARYTVYGWKDIDKEPSDKKVSTTTKGKHMRKGAGRPLSYSQEVDEELLSWVLYQRDLQIGIRRQDIRHKAMTLISLSCLNFKASNGWIDRFMCRHPLSIR